MAAAAVALGFLIGAVQYMPVLEYVPWSPRAGGKGWEHAVSYSMPIEELLNLYLPQFSGILDNYWGRNGIHYHSEYIGAAALLLAGAAFGGETRKSFRRFWIVTLVVAVLWALGGFTPFYHLVYAIVPGTKFFRAPSTMLMVVTVVGTLIFIYSNGYMEHDHGFPRFFTWMCLFVFAMLILVMADNYLLMFVGWEGVGLCSYLLIGFWFERHEPVVAAKKAFVMNRIGDWGYTIGMITIFLVFGSLTYTDVFERVDIATQANLTLICLALFVGATGKSSYDGQEYRWFYQGGQLLIVWGDTHMRFTESNGPGNFSGTHNKKPVQIIKLP